MKAINFKRSAGLLAILLGTVGAANAQFRKPEDAIRYRQSVMFTMGNHFYARLGGMANGRVAFDAKLAADNADIVATLSRLPWMAFPPGTDSGSTNAKSSIWTEQDKFKDLSEKMQAEVAKLVTASRANNLDTLKSAYRSTANSCKACHDAFVSE